MNPNKANILYKNRKLKIAYILGCFPDDTPTFIFNEMVGLDHLRLDITIFSIHKSDNKKNHLDYKAWLPKTIYADPLYSSGIILSHLYFLFLEPSVYFKLLFQYKEFGGKRAFWEGVYFSRVIKKMGIKHVHAHFAWKTTDIARVIKKLTNIPYSFTAHQSDIHRKVERLVEKLNEARFVITCTRGNKEFIGKKYGKEIEKKTYAIYHGINLDLFNPIKINAAKEYDIMSVGNLIEVKGFKYLIEACRILNKKGILNNSIIVGEGEDKDNLQKRIDQYGLKEKLKILNRVPQYELAKLYGKAKVFVLPVIVIDGAPHGIPNVIPEAMATCTPVVATNVPHIPELIEHEKDGLLVSGKNPQALASSIENLLFNEKLRKKLGENGREKIVRNFYSKRCIQELASIFDSRI